MPICGAMSAPTATRPLPRLGRRAAADESRPLKVVFFTTSYPRHADDFAGRFVSDPVERLRARGIEVEVVHPGVYNDYGVAYNGGGIIHASDVAPARQTIPVRYRRRYRAT